MLNYTFDRISCNHSDRVMGSVHRVCGRATSLLYSCPRAPAVHSLLAQGDSAPTGVQRQGDSSTAAPDLPPCSLLSESRCSCSIWSSWGMALEDHTDLALKVVHQAGAATLSPSCTLESLESTMLVPRPHANPVKADSLGRESEHWQVVLMICCQD